MGLRHLQISGGETCYILLKLAVNTSGVRFPIDDDVEPTLRARMENHFKICAHCTAVLDGERNLVWLFGDNRAFDLPKEFSKHLSQRIAEYISKK